MSGKDTNIYLHANTTYIIKNITPLDYSTAYSTVEFTTLVTIVI